MSSKSHSLNLWNIEDDTSKLDIDVTSAKVAITTTGSQFIEITPALKLIDAVGGDIPSVSSALHTLTASVTAGNAGSAAASALVQSNLDAYQTSNDSSLATLNATVVANKAITDANHTSDAASRVALETSLETKISDEETARISADDVLTASLATEITNRTSAISAEATARLTADTSLQTQLDTEKSRLDGILSGSSVDLDSFLEVVNSYTTLNTDALAQIAALNTALIALTARVDDLTSP